MSGTAPSDPAPGGSAPGLQQTPLDSNQHGQTQNILDETADTRGSKVDRDIGSTIDAGKGKGGLSGRVDDLLNRTSEAGTEDKSQKATDEGFKVGDEVDLHGLASSKQP